jgi:hypothetical protein
MKQTSRKLEISNILKLKCFGARYNNDDIHISNDKTRLTFSQNDRHAEISYYGSRSWIVVRSAKGT